MEEIMNGIVKAGRTPEESVLFDRLEHYTTRIPVPYAKKITWAKIEHLYIFGTSNSHPNPDTMQELAPGAYVDVFGKWVLVAGAADKDVQKLLDRCSARLEKLVIRFTGIQELNIRRLTGLRSLMLEQNRKLHILWGLEQLQQLRKLYLTWNTMTELVLTQILPELKTLDIHNSSISDLTFLRRCPELQVANLSRTAVTTLPDLSDLQQLKVLNFEYSKLRDLGTEPLPKNLAVLNLHKTEIVELPYSISQLRKLQILDLSSLRLKWLPAWLPDLELEFTRGDGDGIRLRDTTIQGVDMSIFDQNREMIVQWFHQTGRKNKHNIFVSYASRSPGMTQSMSHFLRRETFFQDYHNAKNKLNWLLSLPQESNSYRILSIDSDCLQFDGKYGIGKNSYPTRITQQNNSFVEFTYSQKDLTASYTGYRNMSLQEIAPRWLCGRYTPPEGFDAKDWSFDNYRKAWELGEPLFYPDGEPQGKPLNELKIVFLGDGEAGKSHTIARLLQDGKQVNDFKNLSTPGIVIKDKFYTIGGKKIQVHFWDFGGQEILHSMHRMFLTEKTLYVVVLNVREGNQDERARYWLHNLRSFAGGAPAMLVLNKMDMNKNASVNEKDLRTMYPCLTRIVKMSALEDSDEYFRQNFVNVLEEQIGGFEYLESPFLPAWSRLKNRLQKMKDSYIRGEAYRRLCNECGVEGSDDVRIGLLNWFSNLGVSFSYNDSYELKDYVVLRPDWITNAVYIILFNKINEVKNGLVNREVIHRMLQSKDTATVRRTMEEATYTVEEVNYVLSVFRKFRLSFLVDNQWEFMPMLCDANSTDAAAVYEQDPDALEFRMHYDYLPHNVIHRLMVERRQELDIQNVWLTGARFVWGKTGLSAVVKSEGNLLRIMVRSDNRAYKASMYLNELKSDLEDISMEMGLAVSRMEVAYKHAGTVECFSYRKLMNSLKAGLKFVASEYSDELIAVDSILKQSDHPADQRRSKLLKDITLACEKLQDNQDFWDKSENSRTTYIRDILMAKGYIVLDQHLAGLSQGGKQAGELDLEIRLEADAQWTIFEALNLENDTPSDLRYWNSHLIRLLDNYNSAGRPFLFHVSYVRCKKDRFRELCGNYEKHIRNYSPHGFNVLRDRVQQLRPSEDDYLRNQFLQIIESVYDCGGAKTIVYHFFLRIGQT